VPLVKLKKWFETKRKEGCLVDYKVFAALYLSSVDGIASARPSIDGTCMG